MLAPQFLNPIPYPLDFWSDGLVPFLKHALPSRVDIKRQNPNVAERRPLLE